MAIYQKNAGAWRVMRPNAKRGSAWPNMVKVSAKTEGTWRQVWPDPPEAGLSGTSPRWDQMSLSWVVSGTLVDSYRLERGGTILTEGATATAYSDSGLLPATAYTYTLKAFLAGKVVAQDQKTFTTVARADPGLAASPSRWDTVGTTWADSDQGSVDNYRLLRNGSVVYSGSGKAFSDTGLLPGTKYDYLLECRRGTSVIATDTASATTPVYADPALVATAVAYDRVNLSWTDSSQGSVDGYKLYRGSTLIYSGTTKSYSDTGRSPGTAYSYRLDCVRGSTVIASDTASATVPALPAFSVSASATAWNSIQVSWTNLGAGWTYYVQTSVGDAGWVSSPWTHGGLSASTYYSYSVLAHYNGVHYLTATAGATTPARPTSTGSAHSGVSPSSSSGWTGSTRRTLGGNNIGIPVGGTMTNITLYVYGYNQSGLVEPLINGGAYGGQVWVSSGAGWRDFPLSLGFAAGTFTTGCNVGGSGWGQSGWHPWSGQRWDYYVCTDRIDYWYYSGREADEELRQHAWWRDDLAEREVHLETWSDEDGAITRAKVTDRGSGEVLVDWEA